MSSKPSPHSYSVKARPNLYDLSIMDGVLAGGGDTQAVKREAYWSHTPSPEAVEMELMEHPDRYPLYDDLDDL